MTATQRRAKKQAAGRLLAQASRYEQMAKAAWETGTHLRCLGQMHILRGAALKIYAELA